MGKRILKTGLLLIFLSLASVAPAQTRKYLVSGSVADAATGQPLPDVNIAVVGANGGGTTNQTGQFSFSLARIPSILYFSHVGYSVGSYQVEKSGEKDIRILLEPETQEIQQVTITGERISKLIGGDTLNIIDFEIEDGRIVLLASPYRHVNDMRIYLANLSGDTLCHLKVKEAGKQIKFPEIIMPQTEYLIRDFTGQVNFLDKNCAHEVKFNSDKLSFGNDTPYSDFIGRVLPVKCEMQGKLVFQVSTMTKNFTWYFGRGAIEGQRILTVNDPKGNDRYVSKELQAFAPRSLDCSRNVSAPVIRKGNELFVFDFFDNHIVVFDSDLYPVKKIPISFQNIPVTAGIFFHYTDVDVMNFTQTIPYDEITGKAYAFFRSRSDNKQYLKEINLETGKIDRVIEIPDFPNISNIRVYDNALYFLHDTRIYPFYRMLYRMIL